MRSRRKNFVGSEVLFFYALDQDDKSRDLYKPIIVNYIITYFIRKVNACDKI